MDILLIFKMIKKSLRTLLSAFKIQNLKDIESGGVCLFGQIKKTVLKAECIAFQCKL